MQNTGRTGKQNKHCVKITLLSLSLWKNMDVLTCTGKPAYFRVGQSLRNRGQTHRQTRDQVHLQPSQVIPGQPGEYGKTRAQGGIPADTCHLLHQKIPDLLTF